MNYGINLVFCEDFIKTLTVTDIAFVEFNILSRNFFDTFYTFALAVAKIIEYNSVISRIEKLNAGVRTDESGTAGNKNRHLHIPPQ